MRPRNVRRPVITDRSGQRRHRPDYMLVLFSVVLLLVGLIVVYAISPGLAAQKHVSENYYVTKQILTILLGVVTFTVVSRVPLRLWRQLQKPLIVLAAVATLIALVMPVTPDYPAHRWIRIAGQSFQSVELIKFAMVTSLAGFLADRVRSGSMHDTKKTLQPLLILLGLLGVIVAGAQRDLGSSGVLVVMMAAMAFVAGLPMKRIMQIGGIIVIGLVLLTVGVGYRRDRIFTFLHPEHDCQDVGYQACQALIAVGSGGLVGKGLGHGAQAYGYLPEASNDSIFAIMAEKFGFIGTTVLLCIFMLLFSRIKSTLERAPDMYSRLMVAGVFAWLSTQTLINIGAMIGLLPLKGITLPFISAGGTSVIFVTAAIGLIFQVSHYTTFSVNTELDTSPNPNPVPNDRKIYSYGYRRS